MTLRGVLARNLRRLRRAACLSQEELAAQAGLNRNYAGMIERQEHAASVDVLERLAAVLAVEAAELLRSEEYAGSPNQEASQSGTTRPQGPDTGRRPAVEPQVPLIERRARMANPDLDASFADQEPRP